MSIKISVIIPVYNAEAHITECMNSLINQTLLDCEFIFVNDGSRDKSQEIIESYKKNDDRIKLINQENKGVSTARNVGIDVATGEYIGFVDADDYVEPEMYETLYREASENKCDVIISHFKSEMDGKKIMSSFPFDKNAVLNEDFIKNEIIPYLIKSDRLNSVCNKIFNQKLIKKYNVEFPYKVALGEDGVFNLRFFCSAESVKYIDYAGYHYKEVLGSATRNLKEKDYFTSAMEAYARELPEINHDIDQIQLKRLKALKLVHNVMSFIHLYFNPTKDLSLSKRYRYVKSMIWNPHVSEALSLCGGEFNQSLGRYEKMMLQLINKKFTFGLYCLTAYSRYRNK